MKGPFPDGTFVPPVPPSEWSWERGLLIRGRRYRVIEPFVDGDGDSHEVGDEWVFLYAMFSKFDDMVILCIRRVTGGEWTVPLFWGKDQQVEVLEHFQSYVTQV